MADPTHQLQSLDLPTAMAPVGEDMDLPWTQSSGDQSDWRYGRSSKQSPRPKDFKNHSLLMDTSNNPSWVGEELIRRRFAVENYPRKAHNPTAADTFSPSLIWACCKNKDLSTGTRLHLELQRRGLVNGRYSDALITMYAKCGELQKAQALLDMHSSTSVIAWTALIAIYAQQGQGQNAFNCFEQMQCKGISPNAVTYVCILKACAAVGAIFKGKQIHDEISRRGLLEHNIVLGGALVDMYAKCGALPQAHSVLENLPSRNVVSWNALIAGYAQKGRGQEEALKCFDQMQCEGISPDAVTYVCILKACAAIGAIDKGKEIHVEISKHGLLEHNILLGNALVDMYAKCNALHQARGVLEKLPSHDVISWNALITGYAKKEQGHQALDCFEQMQREGICPDAVTYACILKACAAIGAIDKGREIHDEISREGLLKHSVVLGGALVDMYAKCGALPLAQSVLEKLPSRSIIAWNALITGYAKEGQGQNAFKCFTQMQQEGICPDAVTFMAILKACAANGAIDKGKEIHEEILRQGLLEHRMELGGALVDMYARCGALPQAQDLLEKLPSRDVVSWNALIGGYAEHGQGQQALGCLKQMQSEGLCPDAVTFVCALKACAAIGAIEKGKQIHKEILRQRLLDHSIELGSALVDMYVKCGALSQAHNVLEKLPSPRNVVSWNALITGYAKEGRGEQALKCYEQMLYEGIIPDIVTFLCLLNLCCHLGLVEKGQEFFDNMGAVYGLKPCGECFISIVDLLGRAGHLIKAVEVIREMPFPAGSAIWHSLLGASRIWIDVNVGIWAFEQALKVDNFDGVAYVLMADIYAAAGMLEKAKDIEAMRIRNEAWRQPGFCLWSPDQFK